MSLNIQEQTLRALANAGSISELTAKRSNGRWLLMMRVGTVEAPLMLQRGGPREFKTLDAVANVVESSGLTEFAVKISCD